MQTLTTEGTEGAATEGTGAMTEGMTAALRAATTASAALTEAHMIAPLTLSEGMAPAAEGHMTAGATTEATRSMSVPPIRLSAAAMGACFCKAGCAFSAGPVTACCAIGCCLKSLLRAQDL